MASGWPSSPSPERGTCHRHCQSRRTPGLQTFSETARVCLRIAPPVFAAVNIVCLIGKVMNKGVEMWTSAGLKHTLCRPSHPGTDTTQRAPGGAAGPSRRGPTPHRWGTGTAQDHSSPGARNQ